MAHGRLRRLVTRRRLKWVGTVVTAACAALFVATIWIEPGVWAGSENYGVMLGAVRGRVGGNVRFGAGGGFTDPYARASIEKWTPKGIDLWVHFGKSTIKNAGTTGTRYVLGIPLWLATFVFAAPTVYLWRTDRRAKPWQCPKCRYDLRGLDGGVCPECGANGFRRRALHSCSERSAVEPGEGKNG